jgi:hypothetical protein
MLTKWFTVSIYGTYNDYVVAALSLEGKNNIFSCVRFTSYVVAALSLEGKNNILTFDNAATGSCSCP